MLKSFFKNYTSKYTIFIEDFPSYFWEHCGILSGAPTYSSHDMALKSVVRPLRDHLLWFLMRNRPEYWCSFWLTPFEWVFANRNFYHFWHHDFTSLLLHLLYTLTWVTHFIFHNKIPVESSHELLKSNHQKLQQSQKLVVGSNTKIPNFELPECYYFFTNIDLLG